MNRLQQFRRENPEEISEVQQLESVFLARRYATRHAVI